MSTIFYKNADGIAEPANLNRLPENCGKCKFCSKSTEYSHYDDLEGFDVSYKTIVCNANKMVLKSFRLEGSLSYDYGYEERTLGTKPDNCPLFVK